MKFKNFFPQKDNNYVVSKNLKLGLDIVLEVFRYIYIKNIEFLINKMIKILNTININ